MSLHRRPARRALGTLTALALVTLVVIATLAGHASAQEAPGLIPVQGRLTNADDTPVTDTVVGRFTLYADPQGLMQIWTTSRTVQVDQGYFTAYLGQQTPLDLAIFRDYPSVYLGMTFDDDEEMPLVQIANVPYAGYARFSGDAATLGGRTADELDALNNLGCTTNQVAVYDGTRWNCAPRALNFAEINGVPTGLADGDDDVLGGLSCLDGKVAQALGGTWICADAGNYTATQPVAINGQDISLVPATITSTYIAPLTLTDGQIATNAAIDPDKIAGTAATLEGDQIFDNGTLTIDTAVNQVGIGTTTPEAALDVRGDLLVDGEIRLRTPVQRTLHVSALSFVQSDIGDDDQLEHHESSGYLYMGGGVTTYSADAIAPVTLPIGAVVTRLACYIYDNDSANNVSSNVYFRSRPTTTTSPMTVATVSLSTSSVAAATITEVEDTTISNATISADSVYWLDLYMFTSDSTGTNIRFYGCSIDYTVDRL